MCFHWEVFFYAAKWWMYQSTQSIQSSAALYSENSGREEHCIEGYCKSIEGRGGETTLGDLDDTPLSPLLVLLYTGYFKYLVLLCREGVAQRKALKILALPRVV